MTTVEDTLDDPVAIFFRKTLLQGEAEAEKSDLYCPNCETNLPQRYPFVGCTDGEMSFYCTICDDYFTK